MSVPLSLGMAPGRDEDPLTAGLLLPAAGAVVPVSPLVGTLDLGERSDGRLDGAGERSDGKLDGVDVVYVARPVDVAALRALVGAGVVTGLDLTGRRASADEVADFLAVLAHANTGFVGRAGSADDVLAVLAATVAALCGDDVRSAWTRPDVAALAGLRPGAAAAVREVLLGVEVGDVAGVVAGLGALSDANDARPAGRHRPLA